uniref:Secreted protein n=1 Tax=Strongyloides venezuelensis TaxID=75913 RepID=A0A0K0FKM6_STRVS
MSSRSNVKSKGCRVLLILIPILLENIMKAIIMSHLVTSTVTIRKKGQVSQNISKGYDNRKFQECLTSESGY